MVPEVNEKKGCKGVRCTGVASAYPQQHVVTAFGYLTTRLVLGCGDPGRYLWYLPCLASHRVVPPRRAFTQLVLFKDSPETAEEDKGRTGWAGCVVRLWGGLTHTHRLSLSAIAAISACLACLPPGGDGLVLPAPVHAWNAVERAWNPRA